LPQFTRKGKADTSHAGYNKNERARLSSAHDVCPEMIEAIKGHLKTVRASLDTGLQDQPMGLFVRRWLANPRAMGAVAPSTRRLAEAMAQQTILAPGEVVVELGPGTGSVTRALIDSGLPEDRLILIERDPAFQAYLAEQFPQATVILGDATRMDRVIPEEWRGKVSTVVSSLPLVALSPRARYRTVKTAFSVLGRGGRFVQYTYSLFPPMPAATAGLDSVRVDFIPANLPPASVWLMTRKRRTAHYRGDA
jgi:phosphatidylethanolamine/phosphatidyl-N-methylethanolamine N-methyltransferase